MLNKLPIEILHKIFYILDPKPFQHSPDHHFHYPSATLLPLAQVDHYLRNAIGPLLYSYISLVREYEMETQRSGLYERAYQRWNNIRYAKKFIKELEIPNTMPLSDLEDIKNQIESLTILDGNKYNIDTDEPLELNHLAIVLPNEVINVKNLKRLDLLIDSSTLNTLSSLQSFTSCQIQELNITTRNFPLLSKSHSFQKFLYSFQSSLKKLSYRYTQQRLPTSISFSYDDGDDDQISNNYEFTSVLNELQLTHLSIDLYFLSSRIFESVRTFISPGRNSFKKPLNFTIREPSLAGLLTTEELNRITEFCSNLSTYQIEKIIFAFGIQTEIPYHTSLSILQNLIKFSKNISSSNTSAQRQDPFEYLKQVGTHMIWSIIDDSLFMESSRTKDHPLLSYETNAHYSPSFRTLENFKVIKDDEVNKPIQLIRENSEIDYEFWSQENLSTILQKFSRYTRSSLWD
ncbi:hypothetical protein BN7_1514 [Wickerhamomyces ciferrii]|uniref:Uncharacterized protein n=1 Tax=Wickerhamomyces ciferrii (strain ATCC 14091 / BCRC 22168 / CBS 111 / JCM 3599 / NBRC 0793 / NRRL Y-1031 F-60-10) TaxID=1206466 RepID=K0KAH2_WICCF|nr:uncharacterized protein BN7_1514 [Wickerhamomyces ciferrii]CCH41975.1 hypothetical protein BN7_1514 [Wickerhamomyces ciferrii]